MQSLVEEVNFIPCVSMAGSQTKVYVQDGRNTSVSVKKSESVLLSEWREERSVNSRSSMTLGNLLPESVTLVQKQISATCACPHAQVVEDDSLNSQVSNPVKSDCNGSQNGATPSTVSAGTDAPSEATTKKKKGFFRKIKANIGGFFRRSSRTLSLSRATATVNCVIS
ncbi:unnamed protein product [Allacma fusca]|uniref:Uncharacterized protein n=1 Tax=Allacma fusca TaxID=39272 RepID=A0A8J2PW96_9HEXA|nr:unnamed protein product [Allacma fusca]